MAHTCSRIQAPVVLMNRIHLTLSCDSTSIFTLCDAPNVLAGPWWSDSSKFQKTESSLICLRLNRFAIVISSICFSFKAIQSHSKYKQAKKWQMFIENVNWNHRKIQEHPEAMFCFHFIWPREFAPLFFLWLLRTKEHQTNIGTEAVD